MSKRGVVGLVAFFSAGLLVVGCDQIDNAFDGVRGSGNVITEEREVSDFNEIVILGSGDVTVSVTGTESMMIQAEDNIMPLLTTEVNNGRLELGSKESYSTTKGIKYTITASALQGIRINGSGDVDATDIDAELFEVEISGSGNVDASGVAGTLEIDISGSGTYAGQDLVASVGDVSVSGSGDAVVNVTNRLDASVSGSGSIEYLGDPAVDASTSGSGDISQR